jgi:hypothetical protein
MTLADGGYRIAAALCDCTRQCGIAIGINEWFATTKHLRLWLLSSPEIVPQCAPKTPSCSTYGSALNGPAADIPAGVPSLHPTTLLCLQHTPQFEIAQVWK